MNPIFSLGRRGGNETLNLGLLMKTNERGWFMLCNGSPQAAEKVKGIKDLNENHFFDIVHHLLTLERDFQRRKL